MRSCVPLAVALLGTLAAGCADASPSVIGSAADSTPGPTPIPTVTSPLQIRLHRFPAGLAVIGLSASARELTVEVKVAGLTPGSIHAVRLMSGSCAHLGTPLHSLQPLVMGANGIADVRTTVDGVRETEIPDAGWYLAVYADGTAPSGTTPVMCGDLANEVQQTVITTGLGALVPPGGPDPAAAGTALVRVVAGKLKVVIDVSGLTPGSSHAAQVRRGNCEGEGAVLHPLATLLADAQGHAVSTTLIPGISRYPLDQWFVSVTPPAGLEPVLCGNVGL